MRKVHRHKIIFMGGNLLGCLCLKEFLRWRNVEIITVVGRYDDNGYIIDPKAWNASLLRVAMQKQLPFLQPKTTKNSKFLKELFQLEKPDFIFSVQYDKILEPNLLMYPSIGCINIHYALLPLNRGSFPIPWALIDNQPAGVTIHWMDENIDTGDIITSQEVEIKPQDTGFSLYHKITTTAYKLFKQSIPLVLENKAPRTPQPQNGSNYRSAGYPNNRNIDWTWSAQKIDRMVRALTFPPFPSARTYYKDLEVEILNPIKIVPLAKNGFNPGQIVDIQPSGLIVQTEHDSILVSKVRVNESLVMNAIKFIKYFNVTVGDMFYLKD